MHLRDLFSVNSLVCHPDLHFSDSFLLAGDDVSFPEDLIVYFSHCLFGDIENRTTVAGIGLQSSHTNRKREARDNAMKLRRAERKEMKTESRKNPMTKTEL